MVMYNTASYIALVTSSVTLTPINRLGKIEVNNLALYGQLLYENNKEKQLTYLIHLAIDF